MFSLGATLVALSLLVLFFSAAPVAAMRMPHHAMRRGASRNDLVRHFSAYDGELKLITLTLGDARILNLIAVADDHDDSTSMTLAPLIVDAAAQDLFAGYARLYWDIVAPDGSRLATHDIDLADPDWQQELLGDTEPTTPSFDLSIMRVDVVDTDIVYDENAAIVDVTIDVTNTMESGVIIPFWNLVVNAAVAGPYALSYDIAGQDGLFDVIEPGETREGIVYRIYVDTVYDALTLRFSVYRQDEWSGSYVISLENND